MVQAWAQYFKNVGIRPAKWNAYLSPQVTSKFNMVIAANEKMREEINHLLKDRAYFNKLYQQLVNRLNSGNKMMVDLIEQATLAYDQREEAQNKLQALKERGKQDLQQQKQEMRELQRCLDHDEKLQTFLGVKGQQRIMADLEAREALKRSELDKCPNLIPEHIC
jgi:hypothetical protein